MNRVAPCRRPEPGPRGRGRRAGAERSRAPADDLARPAAAGRWAARAPAERRPGRAASRRAALEHLARQPAALPDGEVGVLDRQLGQRRRAAPTQARVEGGDLAHQDPHRPAVARDVVDARRAGRGPLASAEQASAEQRSAARSKGRPPPPRSAAAPPARGTASGRADRSTTGRGHRRRGRRLLERLAVGSAKRRCAAASCRRTTSVKRAPQGRGVERRRCRRSDRGDVVGRAARLELVEEPEPLLGEGERQLGPSRGSRGPPARASARRCSIAASTRAASRRQRRRLEERRATGSSTPKPLRRRGRPAAWRAASARRARRSCRRRPRARLRGARPRSPAERLLRRACAAPSQAARRRRSGVGPRAEPCGRACRSASAAARPGTTKAAGTMYSGRRPRRARAAPRRRRAPPPARHDVGDEPRSPSSPRAQHHRLAHATDARARARLDLAQLDAEAADLDLVVDPAEELDLAVRRASAPGRRCGRGGAPGAPNGIGHEALGRQVGPAAGSRGASLHAADVQLARARRPAPARQSRSSTWMRGVRDRPADRHAGRSSGPAGVDGDVDRGLGRAVEVVQLDAERPGARGSARRSSSGSASPLQITRRRSAQRSTLRRSAPGTPASIDGTKWSVVTPRRRSASAR